MDFKPALCPSCGGKMQIPDNLKTVKCMYCGIDVVVQDAFRLSSRVKEYTQASPIEKTIDAPKPFDINESKRNEQGMIFILAMMFLVISVFASSFDTAFGVMMAIISLIMLPIIVLIRSTNLKKIEAADIEMKNRSQSQTQPRKIITSYKGQCPYCETLITLKADILGDNCPACQKRVVLRDSKFYSVETPVSNL